MSMTVSPRGRAPQWRFPVAALSMGNCRRTQDLRRHIGYWVSPGQWACWSPRRTRPPGVEGRLRAAEQRTSSWCRVRKILDNCAQRSCPKADELARLTTLKMLEWGGICSADCSGFRFGDDEHSGSMVTQSATGKLPDLSRPSPVLQHRVNTLPQLPEFRREPAR
jgi:hypothetical protein